MTKEEKSEYKFLINFLIAAVVGAIMFLCGMVFAKHNFKRIYTNYDEQTTHFQLMQEGYKYCPYCGVDMR